MRDTIDMAREAGIEHREHIEEMHSPFSDGVWLEDLKHFEALVRADEREACAKVCDGWTQADGDRCAEAIRARGKE